MDAVPPGTTVAGMICAPLAEYWIVATSDAPSGSVALIWMETLDALQPSALAAGDWVAIEMGGELSEGTPTTNGDNEVNPMLQIVLVDVFG